VRKSFTVLVVLAVVVAVGSVTMAASTYRPTHERELYIRPGGLAPNPNPVGMPGTTNSEDNGNNGPLMSAQSEIGGGSSTALSPGPVSLSAGDNTTFSRGSVLVSPTGGSVYTPKQRADREIKGLIRRLR
jgi:hypothetical protein